MSRGGVWERGSKEQESKVNSDFRFQISDFRLLKLIAKN
jgi:hypothetical protein